MANQPDIIITANGDNNSVETISTNQAMKVYKKRFLILLLFCLYSMINSFQWIEYSSLTNVISQFYNVDNMAVNWTSVIYMVTYIPFILPASWLLEFIGLRYAVIIGSVGTTVGAAIKCFSVKETAFAITMFGQTIVALSQLFIISVPPLLAAVWYPDNQVSTATAFGVFGNQFGIALGFIIPPIMLPDVSTKMAIAAGLKTLFNSVFLISLLLTITIILFFDNEPKKPPGSARLRAQMSSRAPSPGSFLTSVMAVCKDKNYVLLVISYGINVGVFYAISTVLNQMVAPSWPQLTYLSGAMGLIIVISGMVGSVVCGQALDRTHAFKTVTVLIYLFSLLSMVLFAFVVRLPNVIWPLYVASAILGFFMTGYLPLGFEFAAEITYPQPENTTAGLLNLSAQVSNPCIN